MSCANYFDTSRTIVTVLLRKTLFLRVGVRCSGAGVGGLEEPLLPLAVIVFVQHFVIIDREFLSVSFFVFHTIFSYFFSQNAEYNDGYIIRSFM